MSASVAVFACMDAMIKYLAGQYPTVQIVFFRNFCGFLPLLIFFRMAGLRLANLKTKRWQGHLLRSIYGLGAMSLYFYCFGIMPLIDVIAIGFAAPILMAALSTWLLKERVGTHRWMAILLGFGGVLVMVQPGAGLISIGSLLALIATLFYALAIIQVRLLSRTEFPGTIVFYVTIFAVMVSGALLPFFWRSPTLFDFGLLVAIGFLGGIGQILLTLAFRLASVAVIAPFEYSALIWGGLLGWALWGEVPQSFTLIGALLVIASGLYILYRERKSAVQEADNKAGG